MEIKTAKSKNKGKKQSKKKRKNQTETNSNNKKTKGMKLKETEEVEEKLFDMYDAIVEDVLADLDNKSTIGSIRADANSQIIDKGRESFDINKDAPELEKWLIRMQLEKYITLFKKHKFTDLNTIMEMNNVDTNKMLLDMNLEGNERIVLREAIKKFKPRSMQSLQMRKTVEKAVNALYEYQKMGKMEKKKGEHKKVLFEDEDEVLLLQFVLHKPTKRGSFRPIRIPLLYSLIDPELDSVCLFANKVNRLNTILERDPVPSIKIIEFRTFRKEYPDRKDRRAFLKNYKLFLCDQRLEKSGYDLRQQLGNEIVKQKKFPWSVHLSYNVQANLRKARDSGYLYITAGSNNFVVRIGDTSFTPKKVIMNVMSSIDSIVDQIPSKWENVLSINIKTASSIAFPLMKKLPKELIHTKTMKSFIISSEHEFKSLKKQEIKEKKRKEKKAAGIKKRTVKEAKDKEAKEKRKKEKRKTKRKAVIEKEAKEKEAKEKRKKEKKGKKEQDLFQLLF